MFAFSSKISRYFNINQLYKVYHTSLGRVSVFCINYLIVMLLTGRISVRFKVKHVEKNFDNGRYRVFHIIIWSLLCVPTIKIINYKCVNIWYINTFVTEILTFVTFFGTFSISWLTIFFEPC